MLATLTMVPDRRASMAGSRRRVRRTGERKLTVITSSTCWAESSGTGVRMGMAALLTKTSTCPNRSSASAPKASTLARSPRSRTQAAEFGAEARQSAKTESRRSARRPTIPTV
jgi:hypothetical protein